MIIQSVMHATLALCLLLVGSNVFAAEEQKGQATNWSAQIHRSQDENQIPDLFFSNIKIPVTLMAKDDKLRPLVTVKGEVKVSDAKLFLVDGVKKHPLESKKEFSVFLYLNSAISELNLELVKADGVTQKEKILIVAPEIQEYHIGSYWGELSLSVGGGNFRYYQTRYGDFSSYTGLLSASYRTTLSSIPRLGIFGDLDLSVWTIHSSPTSESPQLLRFQASAAYSVLSSQSRFSLHPLLGVQYLTVFANGSPFGFSNLIAPETGFRLKYLIKGDDYGLFRLVYVPLGPVFKFKEYGIDLSLTYSKLLGNHHRLDLGFGYWNQKYSPTTTSDVRVGFLHFKVGYSI